MNEQERERLLDSLRRGAWFGGLEAPFSAWSSSG